MAIDGKKAAEYLEPVIKFIKQANALNESERGKKVAKKASELSNKLVEEGLFKEENRERYADRLTNEKSAALQLAADILDRYSRLRDETANSIGKPYKASKSSSMVDSDAQYFKSFGTGKVR